MEKDDKILGLIEKMNIRMEKMNSRMGKMDTRMMKIYNEFDNRFDEMENRLNQVEVEIKKNGETITRVENKMDNKLGALFDGHEVHNNKLDEISKNMKNINQTLSKYDLKIRNIDNVKEEDQNNEY